MNQMPPADGLLRSRTLVGLAVVVILLVLFGLLAVSYTLFMAVVTGIVLAALLLLLLRALSRRKRIALLALIIVAFLSGAALLLRGGGELYPSAIVADVPAYSLTIRPGETPGTFVASEEADVKVEDFAVSSQPTRVRQSASVTARSKGLFLYEVTVTPLADLRVSLPDGGEIAPMLLTDMDSRLNVKLQDLPKGSFYAARHALGLVVHPYLDTETLTWSPTDLSETITFAYIPSPAYHLRPLLGPFLTVSSVSQWLVGALMALLTALFGTFVQPALMEKLKASLSPWLPAWMKAKEQQGGR